MTTAGILLAAGESSRMGRSKPLLEWGGTTLIEYQIEELRAAVDHVVVVLGNRAEDVSPLVRGENVKVVLNEGFQEGRASSLRAGALALEDDIEALIVLNVDQPRPRALLKRLMEEHLRGGGEITIPSYKGERGHPPALAGSLLPEIRKVEDRTLGLRGLVERHERDVKNMPFETDLALLDMDLPDEYEKAKRSYFEKVDR